MAKTVDPSAKLEADALLTALGMAERHQYWGMMTSILTFIREAGGRFAYLGPGVYAIAIPPHPEPKEQP